MIATHGRKIKTIDLREGDEVVGMLEFVAREPLRPRVDSSERLPNREVITLPIAKLEGAAALRRPDCHLVVSRSARASTPSKGVRQRLSEFVASTPRRLRVASSERLQTRPPDVDALLSPPWLGTMGRPRRGEERDAHAPSAPSCYTSRGLVGWGTRDVSR